MTQHPYGSYGQPGYGGGYGAVPGSAPGPPPDNNLAWGIVVTALCCMPLGIVSIIKAAEVNKWAAGQFDAARESAEVAKKWAMWGAIAAAIAWVLFIIVYVLFFVILFSTVETTTPNWRRPRWPF